MFGTVLSCSTDKWQYLCHLHQRKMIVHVFQKAENATLILVDNYLFFCYMQIFDGPLHTVVLIGSTINFKRLYQTKQCKEEKIFFIHTCAESGFRNTSLKGALPYILLGRLKACSTITTPYWCLNCARSSNWLLFTVGKGV